jgi:hypothetical protein
MIIFVGGSLTVFKTSLVKNRRRFYIMNLDYFQIILTIFILSFSIVRLHWTHVLLILHFLPLPPNLLTDKARIFACD